jgi:hypothetical protein
VSIIVFQLVPQGMVFGADRNVTTRKGGVVVHMGQSQRPKVLKWPNRDVALHYVGQASVDASIDDQPMDLWLYDFLGRHLDDDLASIAAALCDNLNQAREEKRIYREVLIHLGAFEKHCDDWRPQVWFIHNTEGMDERSGVYHLGDVFTADEQIDRHVYFGGKPTSAIREHVDTKLFQFRQGSDLGSFGVVDEAVRAAIDVIQTRHPESPLPDPTTLKHWEDRIRFSILTYGAFFGAFYEPYEQFVGGGVDTVALPWPDPVDLPGENA